MQVHHLFSTDDGESHFADIDIELGAATIGGRFSAAIPASDGESRVIGAGEVLLVEDTWGKGHQSIAINDRPRSCLFIAIG